MSGLRAWKPKSNIILTASIREKLLKSRLAVHDFNGSYLISSSNKGGYGNGNPSISGNNHNRNRIYSESGYSRKRSIILSIRVDKKK